MRIYASIILFLSLVITGFSQSMVRVIIKAGMYANPTVKSKLILTVKKGATFSLSSEIPRSGWYHVSLLNGNVTGWIHGNSLEIIKEVAKVKKDAPPLDAWTAVASGGTGASSQIYFANPSKIVKKDGLIYFWVKAYADDKEAIVTELRRAGEPVGTRTADDYEYVLDYWEADCSFKTMRLLRVVTYWKTGDLMDESAGGASRVPVIPDSTGETFLIAVCKMAR